MAQKTKKEKQNTKKQKQIITIVSVVVVIAIGIVSFVWPDTLDEIFDALGVTQTETVPITDANGNIGIHIIDIGQGDSVLIQDNNEFALIDTGEKDKSEALIAYLNGAGVTRLKYMIMTHPHADHFGGMQTVAKQIPIDTMILPDFEKAPTPTSKMFQNLLQILDEKDVTTKTAQEGDVYPLGVGNIKVLGTGIKTESYNNLSIVTKYTSNGISYLGSGDAEKAEEQALLQSQQDFSADIFKAGHHGSSTSNTIEFLQAIKPKYVAVSCGLNNSYGHPHREARANFEKIGAKVYRTDLNGNIVFRPNDSGGISVGLQKEEVESAA